MCVPSHFKEDDIEKLQQYIRDYGFGLLVVADEDGIEANHVPFHLSPEEQGSLGHLQCHAREGARVVAAARRQPELDALIEEITHAGGYAVALAGDVKDEAFAKALVELVEATPAVWRSRRKSHNQFSTLRPTRRASPLVRRSWLMPEFPLIAPEYVQPLCPWNSRCLTMTA